MRNQPIPGKIWTAPSNRAVVLCVTFCLLGLLVTTTNSVIANEPKLLVGQIEGRPIAGLELIGLPHRRVVLGNDGWLFDFDPRHTANQLRIEKEAFQPLDALSFRKLLYNEFGNKFEVVTTQHFVVVQPRGSKENWPDRFEQLHRSFLTYFRVRNVKTYEGNFPMVAIVYPDQAQFLAQLPAKQANRTNVLGLYDRTSNRISMYDHGGRSGSVEATICHEAAHQSAFNVGIHSRVVDTPHWIVEGIGCIFQSPDLIEGRLNGDLKGRCDPDLLWLFRQQYADDPQRLAAGLEALITENNMFRDSNTVERAYVVAWALTFYLAERREADFATLLEHYSQLPPFESYPANRRVEDFQKLIGGDPRTLARQITRYLDQF